MDGVGIAAMKKLRETFELFAAKGAESHETLQHVWTELVPHLSREERRALNIARSRAVFLKDRIEFDRVCDTIRRRLF